MKSIKSNPSKCCVACLSNIDIEATKCRHCGTAQSSFWRRNFSEVTTIMSLLIAFISVLGVVGPQILTLIFGNPPVLSATIREVKANGIEFDVINIGRSSAVLDDKIVCQHRVRSEELGWGGSESSSLSKKTDDVIRPDSSATFEFGGCCGGGGGYGQINSNGDKSIGLPLSIWLDAEWDISSICVLSFFDDGGQKYELELTDYRLGDLFDERDVVIRSLRELALQSPEGARVSIP